MKTALTKGWTWFLGILMTALGFSGCERIGIFRCEYGEPHADYKLLGDVADTKGKPIQGIRVVYDRLPEDERGKDTLYTDEKGHFEKDLPDYGMWYSNVEVRFEDVDGGQNGSFRSKVLKKDDLEIEQTKKGDKKWYEGAFSIHADAVLEEDN